MGGSFGATSKRDIVLDVFFGVDYHSHLGTRRAGMAAVDAEIGFQREIHKIENSPFRTKFEGITEEMRGNACIGCISDSDPQPILIRSHLGTYAITVVGCINNAQALIEEFLASGRGHFEAHTGGKINATELTAALIDQKETFAEGIRFAQEKIEGSMCILILKEDGHLIAARDRLGRLPVLIGKDEDGYCVSFESFAFRKLEYIACQELKPAEIVEITPERVTVLAEGQEEMRICAFLWTYYGYPNSYYEGINVEVMRNRNGALLAKRDSEVGHSMKLDYVSGVPDSGTPHAIGYANTSGIPFARPFIKYTPTWPRSFMPNSQKERNHVAKMKMRSACPPIMYGCKYLNFSRSTSEMDLIARRAILKLEGEEGTEHIEEYLDGRTERGKAMRKCICEELHFDSLEYQSLDNLIEAIGLPACKLCTYCWDGKE